MKVIENVRRQKIACKQSRQSDTDRSRDVKRSDDRSRTWLLYTSDDDDEEERVAAWVTGTPRQQSTNTY